jgi:subtilisin-like proprotein convertase family protein
MLDARNRRTNKSLGRRLRCEMLEDRWMLSANPSPVVDQSAIDTTGLPTVMAGGFRLTTTASTMPIYLQENGATADDVHTDLVQSRPLINLDAFRADPRFVGIDGHGFSSVIIDTGIDLNHPFFGPDADSNGIADRIVYQYDFSGTNDSNASDVDGHGSNVASIVASQDATYGGMAPATNIIALKVFTDSGSGSFADVEEALQWVVANATTYNIASVNMSLGDSGNYNVSNSLYGLGDELAALNAENVIVVSAAGNGYFENQTQGVSYPASDPNSLAVSAVWDGNDGGPINWADGATDNSTGADRITSFSQRSTTMTSVFAPGAFITGANQSGGTVTEAGTSQASPHIAGIATLAQQLATQVLGRRLSMSEFTSLLNSTGVTIFDGDDEDDNVTNTQQSYRRVDVLALGNAIWAMGIQGSDLVGTQFGVAPENLHGAGGQTTANLTVHNQGNTSTAPFDVKFYLSDDPVIDPASDMPLSLQASDLNYDPLAPTAYHVSGGLAALSNYSATVKLSVPVNDPFLTDGQYYIGMVVDADGDVAEANETNNRNQGQGLDGDGVTYSLTYTNPATISIPDSGVASPYPSSISVSGLAGSLTKVSVSLFGLTHTFPDDIDVLLVGPAGQKMILMSDVGGSNDVSGVNLVFDDSASSSLPNSTTLTSGTFKPTNIGSGDTFPATAPAGPYGSTLSVFNGTNPNGTWRLFVVDDQATDSGSFSGGWSVTFALANTAPTNPTNVTLPAINEDVQAASNTGQLVSMIVASSGSTDADGNPLGVAVTSVDNGHGQWQYEASANSWQDLNGVSLSAARLLGPAYYVRFVPSADFNVNLGATPQFGFKIWDETAGNVGGTMNATTGTAFSGAAALATEPVMAVNDAPSFSVPSAQVAANEDAGAVLVAGFATNILPGPATATDEAGQTLVFQPSVTATTGTLAFDVAPSIDPVTGTLTFTAAANTNGTATVDVALQDSGSGVAPNVNVSVIQEFVIAIAAVNDAPVFTIPGTPVAVDEDAGAVSVSGFATNIGPGPATATDEVGQTLAFLTTVVGTTGTLSFDVVPSIDPVSGALSFTTSAETNGTATVDVVLQDNGGSTLPNVSASGVEEFTIAVAAVNDEQVLAVDAGLTVNQSSSATITSGVLQTTDVDDVAADLLYTVGAGPLHGSLLVNGTPATQFSQQQVDAGVVTYQNDGAANSADAFDFVVDDGKGTTSNGTFNIAIRSNPGDFDQNLVVDAGDYVLWRKTAGATAVPAYSGADGNGDTTIDQADYTVWQSHFGDAIGVGGGASVEVAGSGERGAGSQKTEIALAKTAALVEQPPALPGVRVALPFSYAPLASEWRIGAHDQLRLTPPAEPRAAGVLRDEALVAWLSSRGVGRREDGGAAPAVGDGQDCPSYEDSVDNALDALGAELVSLV